MISSLKDLEKLLKLCRKQGVTEIRCEGVELKLGDLPMDQSQVAQEPQGAYENFPQGELTPEQLMFYSAGGLPENDPFLSEKAN